MDLCDEKKFIKLDEEVVINRDRRGDVRGFIRKGDDTMWLRDRTLGRGSYGSVELFRSNNSRYSDLAVKFPLAGVDNEEIRHEIKMVELFSRERCENLLQLGTLIDGDTKIIVMERLHGDLLDLPDSKSSDAVEIFIRFVLFISSAMTCALKKGYYFMDIKLENIGWRMCRDGIRFTFIDFGSFFETDDEMSVTTLDINNMRKSNFTNEQSLIYGTCMTILFVRLLTISDEKLEKFDKIFDKLQENKKYPDIDHLTKEYYEKILKTFHKLDNGKIVEPINVVFQALKKLTSKNSVNMNEDDVEKFLQNLRNSVTHY